MAKDIRKKFTVELEFDAAKAPGQVKKVCGNIDKMLDEAGKKRDFKVFEQLADYIQDVDNRLNNFKTKNSSLFDNIFGKDELTNLNAAFKKALDIINNFFYEYKAEYKAINDQIDLMQKGRIESKADNRRELAQRINTLSEKTGGSASLINLKDVGGKTGDVTSIMNLMRTALQGIDTQWTNIFSAPLDLSKFDQLRRTFKDVDKDVLQLRQHIEEYAGALKSGDDNQADKSVESITSLVSKKIKGSTEGLNDKIENILYDTDFRGDVDFTDITNQFIDLINAANTATEAINKTAQSVKNIDKDAFVEQEFHELASQFVDADSKYWQAEESGSANVDKYLNKRNDVQKKLKEHILSISGKSEAEAEKPLQQLLSGLEGSESVKEVIDSISDFFDDIKVDLGVAKAKISESIEDTTKSDTSTQNNAAIKPTVVESADSNTKVSSTPTGDIKVEIDSTKFDSSVSNFDSAVNTFQSAANDFKQEKSNNDSQSTKPVEKQIETPVVDAKSKPSTAEAAPLNIKLPDDYAKENTLAAIRSSIDGLCGDLKTTVKQTTQAEPPRQPRALSPTEKLQLSGNVSGIESIVKGSMREHAFDGNMNNIEVQKLQELKSGVVQVSGVIQTAEQAWSNYSLTLDKTGRISDVTIGLNEKLTKQKQSEAENLTTLAELQQSYLAKVQEFADQNPNYVNRTEELKKSLQQTSNLTEFSEWESVWKAETSAIEEEKAALKELERAKKSASSKIQQNIDDPSVSNEHKKELLDYQKQIESASDIQGLKKVEKAFEQQIEKIEAAKKEALELKNTYDSLAKDLDSLIANSSESNQELLNGYKSRIEDAYKLQDKDALKKVEVDVSAFKDSYFGANQLDVKSIKSVVEKQYKALNIDPLLGTDNLSDNLREAKKLYQDIQREISVMEKDQSRMSDKALASLREQASALQKIYNTEQSNNNRFNESTVIKAEAKLRSLQSTIKDDFANSTLLQNKLLELENAFERLKTARDKLTSGKNSSKNDLVNFEVAKKDVADIEKSINNIISKSQKLSDSALNSTSVGARFDLDTATGRMQALKEAVRNLSGGQVKIGEFNKDFTSLSYSIKGTDGALSHFNATLDASKSKIVQTKGEAKGFTSALENAFNALHTKVRYFFANLGVTEFWQQFKTGLSYIKEVDSAMTELKKVTDETNATYQEFLSSVPSQIRSVGALPSDYINSTADWARLGLNMSDSQMMAKNTAILMNVSEFDNVSDATDALISAMQSYKYEAKDTMQIIDALNAVGNNYAISTADAADSLTRSSAALYAAGSDINESLALTAAANTFVQDPASVGNALKTLSLRLRGTKVELEAAGEDTDGMASSVSNLRDKILALTNIDSTGGFDIVDKLINSYKTPYEIILGIADKWQGINDLDRAAILELIAGKQRANIVAGLLNNPDLIRSAYETSVNSSGSAMSENEKALDSIQGKLNILKGSVQTLWVNAINSDVAKFFLNIANSAMDAANAIGLFKLSLMAIAAYKTTIAKNKWDPIGKLFGSRDDEGNWQDGLVQKGSKKAWNGFIKPAAQKVGKASNSVFNTKFNVDVDSAVTNLDKLEKKLERLLQKRQEFESRSGDFSIEIEGLNQKIEKTQSEISKVASAQGLTGFDLLEQKATRSRNKKYEIDDLNKVIKHLDEYNSLQTEASKNDWLLKNIGELTNAEADYFATIKGGKADVSSFKDSLNAHNKVVKASGIAAKAASIGYKLLNASIDMGISLLLGAAIEGIINWFSRFETAAENARQAAENYNSSLSDFKSNKTTIESIGPEFQKLSKGVDDLGNNISLSSDEFDRYHELSNQIAEMFPTMVSGYDDEGNAIVKLTDATKELNEANQERLKIARSELLQNASDTFTTAQTYAKNTDSHSFLTGGQPDYMNSEAKADAVDMIQFKKVVQGQTNINSLDYGQMMRLLGSMYEQGISDVDLWGVNGAFGGAPNYDQLQNKITQIVSENRGRIISWIDGSAQEQQTAYDNMLNTIMASLEVDDRFEQFSATAKQFAKQYVNGLDFVDVANYFGNKDWSLSDINQTITDDLYPILKNDKLINQLKESSDLIAKFKSSDANVTVGDITKAYQSFEKGLADAGLDKNLSELSKKYFSNMFSADSLNIDASLKSIKDKILSSHFTGSFSDMLSEDFIKESADIDKRLQNWSKREIDFAAKVNITGGEINFDEFEQIVKDGVKEIFSDEITASPAISIDAATSKADAYAQAQAIVNEVTFRNTELTEDQIATIQAYTGTSEDYIKAMGDETSTTVQHVDALQDAVLAQKQADVATINHSKSQAKLQYSRLVKELGNYTNQLEAFKNGEKGATNVTEETTNALKKQMEAVKSTISQYTLLEQELLGTTNAFTEFENAKQRDSASDYVSKWVEMLTALKDGFESGKIASEEFKTAVKSLIPEEEYLNISDPQKRIDAMEEYYNNVLSQYVTLGDDGNLSVTFDNINAFLEKSKEKGLIVGDTSDFKISESILESEDGLKKYCETLGITETTFFSVMTEMAKYDVSWGNSLEEIVESSQTLEGKLNSNVETLDELYRKKEEYLRSGKSTQEIGEVDHEIKVAEKAQGDILNEVVDNVKKRQEIEIDIQTTVSNLDLFEDYKDLRDQGFSNKEALIQLEIESDDGQYKEAYNKYYKLLKEKGKLEEPTTMTVSLALDEVDKQIEAIEKQIADKKAKYGIRADTSELDTELQSLNETRTVLVNTGVVPDEKKQAENDLKELKEYKIGNKIFTVLCFGTKVAKEGIDNLLTSYNQLQNKSVTVTVNEVRNKTTNDGTAKAHGNAFASGNIGLEKSEHRSLVGELGTEMVVDPALGRYYTVGDYGPEFVDLPKGAIIFNHLQTQDLLANGRTSLRGRALVNGNAYNHGIREPKKTSSSSSNSGSSNSSSSGSSSSNNSSSSTTIQDVTDGIKDTNKEAKKFSDTIDFIEYKLTEINSDMDKLNAQLSAASKLNGKGGKNTIINSLIKDNVEKRDFLSKAVKTYNKKATAVWNKIPEKWRKLAKEGGNSIQVLTQKTKGADENTASLIQRYREFKDKLSSAKTELAGINAEISSLAKQKLDNITDAFSFKTDRYDAKQSLIENRQSLRETQTELNAPKFYTKLINNEKKNKSVLEAELKAQRQSLARALKNGQVKINSDDYKDMVASINATTDAIYASGLAIHSWAKERRQLRWDNFDKIMSHYKTIADERTNLINLLSDKDVATEDNVWTKDGLTSLALTAQNIQSYQYEVQKYATKIKELQEQYAGRETEEYYERLETLKQKQWESINAYEAEKDALVELNKKRVEIVKDGIQKEIDKESELVEKKKESLQASKDAHNYERNLKDKTKSVERIQRQIDAMVGDTSQAAIAKRKQLAEELANAQDELTEFEYDHKMETEEKALDDYLEKYKKEKEEEIEALEKTLEDTEKLISDSYSEVQKNTETVKDSLTELGKQYRIDITPCITDPWSEGSNALADYSDKIILATDAITTHLRTISAEWTSMIKEASKQALDDVKTINNYLSNNYNPKLNTSKKNTTSNSSSSSNKTTVSTSGSSSNKTPSATTPKVGSKVKIKTSAKNYGGAATNVAIPSAYKNKNYTVQQLGYNNKQVLLKELYSWVKISDLVGYAKGITGVGKSGFAVVDENNLEEIVLHAGKDGKIEYLTKGSGVIPNDITDNLMQLGQMNVSELLKRNTPAPILPQPLNNNMTVSLDIAEVVHIEHADRDSIPDITDAVQKQLDKYMKDLNQSVKRFVR